MKRSLLPTTIVILSAGMLTLSTPALSQDSDADAELARMLANPIANLMSFPLQSNWDFNLGSQQATRYTMNVQPVIPFSLSDDLNLITRTIMPIIDLEEPEIGFGDHSGLGDITQSFFFSPKSSNGFMWGGGPVFLYPSATDDALGVGHWGMGPTVVLLNQNNGWTVGLLANHLWSVTEGGDTNPDVSASFLQPFISYITETKTTFALNSESSYDWTQGQLTAPLNLSVSQLFKVGKVPFSAQIGGRYYVEAPSGGPEWGLRFTITMLLPAN